MEKMIREAFDGMLMPDNCRANIEQAMAHKAEGCRPRRAVWRIAAAAACLALVLAIVSNPTVVQAMEEVFFPVSYGMDNAFYISSGLASYKKNGTGAMGSHNWILPSGTISGRLNPDPWLVQKEDRLIFTANGERIDITDAISFETPFTYTYVDNQDLIHYLAVGGKFEAEEGVNSVGTIEYVRHKLVMEANPGSQDAGWLSQLIRGSDAGSWQDGMYPWVWKAYEILELPVYLPPYASEVQTAPIQ